MKKLILIIIIMFAVSCSKDEVVDCAMIKTEIRQEYYAKIKAEKLGTNNPKIIKILEDERDRKLSIACF